MSEEEEDKPETALELAVLLVAGIGQFAIQAMVLSAIWRWHIVPIWPSLSSLGWRQMGALLLFRYVAFPSDSGSDRGFIASIKDLATSAFVSLSFLGIAWVMK